MKPSARFVLDVLREHPEGVCALDLKRGCFGERIDAVSQRVGELRRLGYPIHSPGPGGHNVATYWLESTPTLDDFGGALFGYERN